MDRKTRSGARLRSFLALALITVAAATPSLVFGESESDEIWKRAQSLFHFHSPQVHPACAVEVQTDGGPVMDCAGLIDSHDGLSLSVWMRIPKNATKPLPTLLYLHSFASNRGVFGDGDNDGFGPNFISRSFAARGYVVVMPASRGMGGSCAHKSNTGPHDIEGFAQVENPHGPKPSGFPEGQEDHTCSRGWTHLNERDYETKDMQVLLSRLVDGGVSDAARLTVAGFSQGGIQTWMLATSLPWQTQSAGKIQIAAALPFVGGTSSQNTLVPNGRATDERQNDVSLERPYGIPKLSTLVGAGVIGRAFPGGPIRWNDTEPTELHSYSNGWLEFWEKGEPFDTPYGKALAEAFRNKGAYHADDYLKAVRTGAAKPVPVLAIQGWNDATFPAVEALQMYRKLKTADPNYPVSIFLADVGHSNGRDKGESIGVTGSTAQVKEAWQRAANDFLDAYALGGGEGASRIVSMSTECTPGLGDIPPRSETVVASDWDSIHPDKLKLRNNGSLTTRSGPPNLQEEVATDPALQRKEWPSGSGCIRQSPGEYNNEGDISWAVPSGGVTLLGLPKFTADYRLSGMDATVITKLWDVDENGMRTLVTRGLYRLALAGGDAPEGKIKNKLFGNHYRFAEGHRIELEISQTDVPFLQPNKLDSSIQYSNVMLELPTTGAVPSP